MSTLVILCILRHACGDTECTECVQEVVQVKMRRGFSVMHAGTIG